MSRSRYVTFMALSAALVVVLILMGEIVNARLSLAALTGVPVLLMTRRYGEWRGGVPVYVAGGLLALLITPVGALLFGGLFGLYAIIKAPLERYVRKSLLLFKVLSAFVLLCLCWRAVSGILPEWAASIGYVLIPPLLLVFVIYDRALDVLVRMIERQI